VNFPNFTFWSHLLATVGVEVCCLAALGFVAQLAFRRAVWQRTIWQITVICLLLLPASEWTGFGRGFAWFFVGPKRTVHTTPVAAFVMADPRGLRQLTPPPSYHLSAAAKPAVWWPGWVWLAGTVIILGRMAAAQFLLLALRLCRERIADASLRKRVASIAKSVGLRRRICLLRLPESISPMAFGILWPTIGLPPGFESKFSATETGRDSGARIGAFGGDGPPVVLGGRFRQRAAVVASAGVVGASVTACLLGTGGQRYNPLAPRFFS
jgi:beta-lactamase regulating signal transducer with metallopeptidase domain